jgi:hypothetical protein
MKIACVLKPSIEYAGDYVGHLAEGIAKHCGEAEFVTLINSEWPGWWSKMRLFHPDVKGDLLYFDLDTVIVGPIAELFTGKLTMLSDFNLPHYVASGVMFLPEAYRQEVWEAWIKDPVDHMQKHRGHGDGGFLSQFYKGRAARFQDLLPGRIVSYKNHVRGNGIPKGASVVCFHGRPRPRDVAWKV